MLDTQARWVSLLLPQVSALPVLWGNPSAGRVPTHPLAEPLFLPWRPDCVLSAPAQVLAPADFAFEAIGITNETILTADPVVLTRVSLMRPRYGTTGPESLSKTCELHVAIVTVASAMQG